MALRTDPKPGTKVVFYDAGNPVKGTVAERKNNSKKVRVQYLDPVSGRRRTRMFDKKDLRRQ